MKAIVFHIFGVVSLLLFIAMAVLWGSTQYGGKSPYISIDTQTRRYELGICGGRGNADIELDWTNWRQPHVKQPTKAAWEFYEFVPPPWVWQYYKQEGKVLFSFMGAGVKFTHSVYPPDADIRAYSYYTNEFTLPYLYPLSLLAIIALTGVRKIRRRRRRTLNGECLACGYDLRASTHRCPECGAVIPPSRTAFIS